MRIRQIVVAAKDLQGHSKQLAALFGLAAPYRDPGVAEFGLDNAVFVFGDQFIEIVSPVQAGTTAGRLIERRGDSGYMLILQTDDLKRDRVRFDSLGVRAIFEADYDDIGAVHLHPKDVGGTIVSVDQPRPAASWRWGGPTWQAQSGRRGEQRVIGVSIDAHDPQAMATRWAQVFALPAPVPVAAGWRLALDGGAVDFNKAGSRGEGVAAFTLAVADRAAVLAAAQAQGLALHGHGVDLCGTRFELVEL